MSITTVLWIALFWGMQIVAQLLFKWGSGADSRWFWGFFGGHCFGVSSLWILMVLYRTMNPNIALGICFGGMFLLSQVAIAVVFRSGITPVQYAGIVTITVGMIMLAVGSPSMA
jgi:multidrug transporter EmrE-like cation transporter